MFRKAVFLVLAAALTLGLSLGCGLVAPGKSIAPTHPQELGAGRPQCATCHADGRIEASGKLYTDFDHSAQFVKDHKFLAATDSQVCAACHTQASCSDCHSGKTMMSPAVKLGNRPDRMSPHPAGYLTVHRLDAKADPGSCFKCHGRANNQKCTICHQ